MEAWNLIATAGKALWASVVRTVVPIVVSSIVSFLVGLGLPVDGEFREAIALFVGAAFGALYYVVIRVLEQTKPWASKLLGSASTPVGYARTSDVAAGEAVAAPASEINTP